VSSDDALRFRSERRTDRELPPAAGSPRQLQVGQVDASDEQHKACHTKKKRGELAAMLVD
jgi:hypothetical protein